MLLEVQTDGTNIERLDKHIFYNQWSIANMDFSLVHIRMSFHTRKECICVLVFLGMVTTLYHLIPVS